MTIELVRTKDILKSLGEFKREGQLICGFSMETENLIENSRKKLKKKNADMIVANSISDKGAGFGVDTNIVTIITENDETSLGLLSKDAVADEILTKLIAMKG